ncbi:DUF4752 family protein [Xenorhabdus bovienii]|uniref:DUF4752 family protein n=1 Tax=Xenorhabdus bovienii TaxID=40576 RepID=UPI003B97298C
MVGCIAGQCSITIAAKKSGSRRLLTSYMMHFNLTRYRTGQTMKIATKGGLVIRMYRQQSDSK